jgi:uncharacterized protein YqjF (DUF2071 family)
VVERRAFAIAWSTAMAAAIVDQVAAAPADSAFACPSGRPLLTAEWRHLVMLNYEIDPAIVTPYVPSGTQLDTHDGRTYASVVGFLFRRTRFFGVRVPWHGNFEEVNLRIYVRRECHGELRRGVTFIRELVPRRAVTLVANAVYGESYRTAPMGHRIAGEDPTFSRAPRMLEYGWKFAGRWHSIALEPDGVVRRLAPGSHEEFIAEHYWGYTALRRGAAEYQVAHPSWRISRAAAVEFNVDVAALYGPQFEGALRGRPASAFWADGSAVRVYRGRRFHAKPQSFKRC